jgi:pectate lyase
MLRIHIPAHRDSLIGIHLKGGSMNRTIFLTIAGLISLALAAETFSQSSLPAFPGAVGFGASTVGGRGGRVIFVTNRNNSGPGSFRDACEASGPRIVIFKTGGTIELLETLEIMEPYITIAGQTAPGGGICLKGELFVVRTDEVIVRNMRFRVGGVGTPFTYSAQLGEGSNNIIFDHCSFSWSRNDVFLTWDTVSDITLQDCIFSEAFDDGKTVSLGPGPGNNENGSPYLTNSSFVRNLIAHGKGRNPKVHYQSEVINNLVYNWGNYACYASMLAEMDFIGNHYISGPSGGPSSTVSLQDPKPSMRIYLSDNRTPELPNGGSNQWSIVNGSNQYQSTTRLHSSGLQPMPSSQVYDFVLDNAGALPQDAVDLRIKNDVRNGTGRLINSETEVGGFPVYAVGTPPVDTDNDGLPDSWESTHGLNPNNASDANLDRNGDGYLNIEEYINSLMELNVTIANAGPDQELCGSTTTTLAGNVPLVGEGLWAVVSGGGIVQSPSNPTSVVTNLQTGANVLSWSISNGGSTTTDTVLITVLPLPTSNFTWQINGLVVTFTSTATNATTYKWTFGDGSNSTQRNPVHEYAAPQSFRVVHAATNSCGTVQKVRRVNLAGASPWMTITPSIVDFGDVEVGYSASRVITVLNSGTDSLDIEGFISEGSIAPGILLDNQGFIIPPGDSTQIVVEFSPGSGGLLSGQLTVVGCDTSAIVQLVAQVSDPTLLKGDLPSPEGNTSGITRSDNAQPSMDLPGEFLLRQNYPNPFNPTTTIGYGLPVAGSVTLKIFNVLGQEIATLVDQEQNPGYYSVVWNAGEIAGGVYFYQLRAGEFIMTKQLVLVK